MARIASEAHGVVTRADLRAVQITRDEIDRRVRSGALIVEYRGVYRVGHRAPSVEARYLAAVWACGEGAVLSGRAAGHLWGLLEGSPTAPEVTAPTERRVKGINTTRARRAKRETTVWRAIPITTPARTLVDLAAVLDEPQLARACHEAGVRHDTTPRQVEAVLSRRPNVAGARKLRAILRGDVRIAEQARITLPGPPQRTALPLPRTNHVVGGRRVDCRWPEQELTVELDGYRFHHSRHAWEQDRRREREARAHGDEFRRYTYGDVLESPQLMMAELRALLS